MIELFIDGRSIETAEGSTVRFSLSAEEITAPGEARERVFPFTLPMSARNRAALGFPEQCGSPAPFNRQQHTAKVVCRGAVLAEGEVELLGCEANADGAGVYRIALHVPAAAWLDETARKTIAETPLAYNRTLNAATIRESWNDEGPVRFLPVKWDEEPLYGAEITTLEMLGYENYYPFVQIKAVLEAIAADAGYRIESKFFDEPFFRSLYMSGRYAPAGSMENVFRMDFRAVRSAADKAVMTDPEGRAFATPTNAYSNAFVGNLVDAPDPSAAGNNPFYGNSFQMIGGRAAFVPEADVIAGFEFKFRIRFTPPVLSGSLTLKQPFRIHWNEEMLYELTAVDPRVDYVNAGVELTLRSTPRLRTKNEPVFFDPVRFDGLQNYTRFTLCRGATVRPVFYAMPEAGAPLAFASVFDHRATQLDLIRAVAHLFGLHFYTDPAAKVVYIEPRFMFFDESREIDWSAKIDPERPVVWSETGNDLYQRETLCYRPGDAAVDRRSAGASPYGAWTVHTTHRFARSGEKAVENPLFTASLDQRNALASAPDASMIVVGARLDEEERVGVFDFPMKIVRYLGMTPLPEGQTWGWPAEVPEYPLAMFHTAGVDWYTLCFDNREGQLGLKNYHEPRYALAETGRELSLHLHLTPSDVEAVRSPNSTCRDFRGRFVFRIRGERFRARLAAIHDYDPAERSTRCTFIVEP